MPALALSPEVRVFMPTARLSSGPPQPRQPRVACSRPVGSTASGLSFHTFKSEAGSLAQGGGWRQFQGVASGCVFSSPMGWRPLSGCCQCDVGDPGRSPGCMTGLQRDVDSPLSRQNGFLVHGRKGCLADAEDRPQGASSGTHTFINVSALSDSRGLHSVQGQVATTRLPPAQNVCSVTSRQHPLPAGDVVS